MKYLLFSDIHGCLPALEKVLDFFEAEHCDMMCIMGDIINYGPRNRIPVRWLPESQNRPDTYRSYRHLCHPPE